MRHIARNPLEVCKRECLSGEMATALDGAVPAEMLILRPPKPPVLVLRVW